MALTSAEVISLFKEMYLFTGLSDAQLSWVSGLFSQVPYSTNAVIFSPGDPPDGFYIIGSGELYLTQKIQNTLTDVDILVPGDFLGEEPLLLRRPHQVSVTSIGDTVLLKAEIAQFSEMIVQYPSIRFNLERMARSRVLVRQHHFNWLNEDEAIYQISRKHEAFLLVMLLRPAAIILVILGLALVGVYLLPASAEFVFLVVMGVLILLFLLWAGWIWLDWSNDYYIVTSQRVVWIEKVIWLYESRVEAPHNSIQAVNTVATLLGQLLGYGDVTVSTFTGKVVLANVGDPKLIEALIQEQWHRSQRNYQRSEREDLRRSVRRITHANQPAPVMSAPAAARLGDGDYIEPSLVAKYFSNILQMRFEKDNTITYRKHWIMLIRKAWRPLLTMLSIVTLVSVYLVGYYIQNIRLLNPLYVVIIGLLLLLFFVFPWFIYNYVDWRNDIYQLTDKNIFDIERKPLGTEVRKAASLEKILSLEHERPGFLGYLLNVGNVIVNFGDAKLTFDGVYEPARIQQDIFTRMSQLRVKNQKAEIAREQDRILSLLEIYHQDRQDEANRVENS